MHISSEINRQPHALIQHSIAERQVDVATADLTPLTLKYAHTSVGAVPEALGDFLSQDDKLNLLLQSNYYIQYVQRFVDSNLLTSADVSAILKALNGECSEYDSDFSMFYHNGKSLESAIDLLAAHKIVENCLPELSYCMQDISDALPDYRDNFSLQCSIMPRNDHATSELEHLNDLLPVLTINDTLFVFESHLETYPVALAIIAKKVMCMLCNYGGVGFVKEMDSVTCDLVEIWRVHPKMYALACQVSKELDDELYIAEVKRIFGAVYEEMLNACDNYCVLDEGDIEEERRVMQSKLDLAVLHFDPLNTIESYSITEIENLKSDLHGLPYAIRCEYQSHCDALMSIFQRLNDDFDTSVMQPLMYNSDFGDCEYYLLASTTKLGEFYDDVNERYQHQQQIGERMELVIDTSSNESMNNLLNHYMCWVLLDALSDKFKEH